MRFVLRPYLRWVQRRSLAADAEPRAAQEHVHGRLAAALGGTRAAGVQDARIWQSLEAYRRHVRFTTHDDYRWLVEDAMRTGTGSGMFERRATTAFGHSSGTRSFIPFTRAHVANFRAFQLDLIAELVIGQGCEQALASPSLVVQGSLEVGRAPGGSLIGYASAVMVERTPWLLKRRLLPSTSDLRLPDTEARVQQIGRALLTRRPRAMTGMPEFAAGVLRALLAGPDAAAVREALRGIEVYAWSGMALGPYRAFFEEHLAPGCRFFDAVTSTEGPLGIRANVPGVYRPALARTLYLFARADDPSDKRFAWELTEGETYDVLLGSFAGLAGYRIGDRVRVVSARPLRFALVPRAADVGATCAALGAGGADVTDYCAYLDPSTRALRLLVEGGRAPSVAAVAELAARWGAQGVSVRLVGAGRIARAAVALSVRGITKLPRLHSHPEVHALIERLA